MEAENFEKNIQDVQEIELKEEKFKKILIIFIVLLLFGSTYYYYGFAKKNHSPQIAFVPDKIVKLNPETPVSIRKKKLESLEKIQKAEEIQDIKSETKLEIKPEKQAIPVKVLKTKIKPTGKSDLLTLANKSSGKNDPFSCSESQYIPSSDRNNNSSSLAGNLPPVPGAGSMGNLPSLQNLPGLPNITPLNSAKIPQSPKDAIEIKGFIGNKVIAEIDGVIEALNENEKINNIKVLNINPLEYTAIFEINGKNITKTMKSISEENNENIEIVKNLHN